MDRQIVGFRLVGCDEAPGLKRLRKKGIDLCVLIIEKL